VYGNSGCKTPFIFIIGTRYKQLFLLSNSSTRGPNVAKVLDTKLNVPHIQFWSCGRENNACHLGNL